MTLRPVLLASLLLFATSAWAEDELRPLETCGPFGEALDLVAEFDELDADRRDVVDVPLRARFILEDGEPAPDRMFFRVGGTETDLRIAPDGNVERLFEVASTLSTDGLELCSHDSFLEGKPRKEASRNFAVGMLPEYTNLSGTHTLAELEEGLDDGRKFYKKMAPGAVSFLVPKLTHIAVAHPLDDLDNLPTVTALKDGAPLGPVATEMFRTSLLIDLDDLEEMGADSLRVEGDYRLFPVPDAKTMRRFASDDDS